MAKFPKKLSFCYIRGMKRILLILTFCSIAVSAQEIQLNYNEAEKILQLPLHCIETEFPNKTGQTLATEADLGTPKELHPVFYGCFDWHSAVHGYWSIIELLKMYPNLDKNDEIKHKLLQNISSENIALEIAYFDREQEYSFERTYGWAWLLKLQQALDTWNTPTGNILSENLQPLSQKITEKYKTYLPKLVYPIRVGTHTNTAFGLSFAYDYAIATNDYDFKNLIENRAKDFYLKDAGCPIGWEPNGYDFLSPCMEEMDIMRKVLNKDEFDTWMQQFLPQLTHTDFDWDIAIVSDRSDGHLVHLDGLNFSRAWVFFGLAKQYPEYAHLIPLGKKHFMQAYPNLVGDAYEGGHWLGSFALYALKQYVSFEQ